MADYPVDLRTIVALKAWEDAKFAADLRRDPKAAMAALAKAMGFQYDNVEFKVVEDKKNTYTLVLPENPMGGSPAELRNANQGVAFLRGGGTVNSYTADCGCSGSITGGCSCGSVFGTPCLACATALLC